MNRKWDVSSKQVRKLCVDEVLARIDEQEGTEFGMIAANEMIVIEIDIDLLKTST